MQMYRDEIGSGLISSSVQFFKDMILKLCCESGEMDHQLRAHTYSYSAWLSKTMSDTILVPGALPGHSSYDQHEF